jgi:hypothetical protein
LKKRRGWLGNLLGRSGVAESPHGKKKKKLMGFGVAHWGGRTALMGHEGGSATLPSSFFLFFNFFLFYYF